VAAFESRPALAALRFAVRDSGGTPWGCAASLPRCPAPPSPAPNARLMQIERWSPLGDDSSRVRLGELEAAVADERARA
jgi:hypothetical protein